MAVRSVAQGKTAAESVHHYLLQKPWAKPARMFNSRFEKLLQIEFDEYLKESSRSTRFSPDKGYIGGFKREEAMAEALRCLHCDCRKKDNCKLRVYSDDYAVERKHYQVGDRKAMTKEIQHDIVIFEPAKCIKCGLCIEISAAEGEQYGLAFEGRGFDVFVNVPLGAMFHEGLSHAAEMCAGACPTGALSMKDRSMTVSIDKTEKPTA
jgi:ferredoxin